MELMALQIYALRFYEIYLSHKVIVGVLGTCSTGGEVLPSIMAHPSFCT